MQDKRSPGKKFREELNTQNPLQIVGTINAYSAMLAKTVGNRALYLSGAGVANGSLGVPDLGISSLNDVLTDAERITAATNLPLLVDIDTGWGGAFNIARTIRSMERAGVAAIHIEDQILQKRCGHRPNKAIVSSSEMVDRIKAAVDSRIDDDFVIMARTDALASEGTEKAIERCIAYVEAGADSIFPEAMITLDQYESFAKAMPVPILANITEFGKTPLFSCEELSTHGVDMVLYPLSAFRAMNQSALKVYQSIASNGCQNGVITTMQTREELYNILGYHDYEKKLDSLFYATED